MPNNNTSGGPTFGPITQQSNAFDFLDWLNAPMGGRGRHNDDVVRGDGNDRVNSGNGDDIVYTAGGDDDIHAGNGDDTIIGGTGNDEIFGGNGFDTAVFSGSILDFAWGIGRGNRLIVEDLDTSDGDEGTDSIKQVEALQFDDFIYSVKGDNTALVVAEDQITDEDTALTFGVSAYDFDGDALTLDSLSITSSTGASLSFTLDSTTALTPLTGIGALYTFTLDPEAHYQFLADGENAQETLTISIRDANNNVTSVEVGVTIEGVNDSPVALDDTVNATENDGVVEIDLNALISDVDTTDILTITAVNALGDPVLFTVVNGILTIDTSQFDMLRVGDTANLIFSYKVQDDSNTASDTGIGTLTVNVAGANDAPTAQSVTLEVTENVGNTAEDSSIYSIDINGLVNDVDAGDIVSITAITPSGDPVDLTIVNGVVEFDTNQFDALGIGEGVSFDLTYTVQDDSGMANDTATGVVTVNVNGVNDAPAVVASDPGVADEADGPIVIDLNPLASDVDENDDLAFSIVSIVNPATGRNVNVAFAVSDGILTIDPTGFGLNLGDALDVEINFSVSDGTATVFSTIPFHIIGSNDEPPANETPVANDLRINVGDEALVVIDLNSLASDADAGDVLSFSNLTFSSDGRDIPITYTLVNGVVTLDPAQFNLSDGAILDLNFNYRVNDGSGTVNSTATGTVGINILGVPTPDPDPVNTAPVANNNVVDTNDDVQDLAVDLNALISDEDGDTLSVVGISFTIDGVEQDFDFDLTAGILNFDPAQFEVPDGVVLNGVVTYIVDDGTGTINSRASGEVTLNITGVADPIEANNAPVTVAQNLLVDLDVSAADVSFDLVNFAFDLDPADLLTFSSFLFTYDTISGDGGGITTLDVTHSVAGTTITFDPTQFGLVDGETLNANFSYVVDDGAGAANSTTTGTVNFNISDPESETPFEATSYVLDFESFSSPGDNTVAITNYEAFTFTGDVSVFETDEMSGTSREGGAPIGVLNGVVSGDNVLAMQADGELTISGQVDGTLSLQTRPTFNLDSMYLTSTLAAGMTVTITTFAEGLIEVDNGFGGTFFTTGLVEQDTFDFVVGDTGPGGDLFIDFDVFSGTTAFDDLASVEITTDADTGNLLIIDDVAITLVTEPTYNIF